MGWRLDEAGQVLEVVATSGSDAAYNLSGAVALAPVAGEAASDSQYLLAADGGSLGLRSFQIDGQSGALTLVDTFGPDQGLGVAIPTALRVFAAFGTRWVILGAAGSSSLSVLQLGDDGSLNLKDHLIDNLQTRFAGLTALEVVQVEGHAFVVAAGSDDGLSLFRLLPGGQLVHVKSLPHDSGLGLQNVSALEATVMGGQIQIFASSQGAAEISWFSIGLDSLGTVIEASDSSADLTGTSGDDLLVGYNGQVTLHGAAGDDVLLAGSGGGALTGGAGPDIFVLCPTSDRLQISDFEVGHDQIDMSLFTGLRSSGQMQVQTLTDGIQLQWDNTEITVYSADGAPLTLQDLWPNGFIAPDRMPLRETLDSGVEYGSSGDDQLNGSGQHDQIDGLGGNDTLSGGGGGDKLGGGDGRDVLTGGKGTDRLWGQAGDDVLKGGGGRDRLYGGTGQDILSGGRGRDELTGGAGRDVFIFGGGHGRDSITDFSPGNDHINLSTLGGILTDLRIWCCDNAVMTC